MMLFAGLRKLANLAAVQCQHDADPRQHRGAGALDDKQQRFRRGLPFRKLVVLGRETYHVGRGIAKEDELFAARQRDRFVELPGQPDERSNISSPGDIQPEVGWAGKGYAWTASRSAKAKVREPILWIRSYLVRCASMASQACSASANVLKGDPPTLMAGLLKLMGRQEATKPGFP